MSEEYPQRFGNYTLLSCLGSGGMGSVYRAYDETLARTVAIKVMLKSIGDQPEFLESFKHEAQAAAGLNHPSIAHIYSFGDHEGCPYIVMELVDGKHLDKMIEEPGMLDQALVMKIGLEVAEGLSVAAKSNLIHGDIKPENILLGEGGIAKLIDFGIASTPSRGDGEIWGTPYYIAPEKLLRQKVDFRSDIYCLGGTLYRALCKKPPFDGPDAGAVLRARLEGDPAPLSRLRPDIAPEVEAIVMRMLQRDPARRYPTYESLINDIRRYLEKTGGSKQKATMKRIVIKGKKPAAAPSPVPEAEEQPQGQDAGAGGKRIVVKGKSTRVSAPSPTIPAAYQRPPVDEEEEERRRAEKIVHNFVTGLIVFVVLAVGLTLVGLEIHRTKVRKDAAELAAAKAEMTSAGGRVSSAIASGMQLRDETIPAIVAKAQEMSQKSLDAIAAEFGEEILVRIKEVPAVEEASEDGAEADKKAAKAEKPKKAKKARAAEDEPPAEVMEDSETAEDGEAADEEDLGPAPLDGLPLQAHNLYLALLGTDSICEEATNVCTKLEGFESNLDPLLVDVKTKEGAEERIEKLKQLEELVKPVVEGLQKQTDELKSKVDAAEKDLAKLLSGTNQLKLAREAAEAEEAARKAAEEEAARKAAAEAADKAARKADLEQVNAVFFQHLDDLKQQKFSLVTNELAHLELKYPESEARRGAFIERIALLADLKNFLIDRLNEEPYADPRGWKVKAANKTTVHVIGTNGKLSVLPWEQIGPKQIVPFIRYYIENPERASKLRLRERSSAKLGAAIYYVTFGGTSDTALVAAEKLARESFEGLALLKDKAIKVLPELGLDGSGPVSLAGDANADDAEAAGDGESGDEGGDGESSEDGSDEGGEGSEDSSDGEESDDADSDE